MTLIRSMILPLDCGQILVPSVAVAEITPYIQPRLIEGAKPWLLGMLPWRGIEVPLIVLEALEKRKHIPEVQDKAAIGLLNMINPSEHHPFIGVLLQEFPKLCRLMENDLTNVVKRDDRIFHVSVSVREDETYMIDLEQIQNDVVAELERLKL